MVGDGEGRGDGGGDDDGGGDAAAAADDDDDDDDAPDDAAAGPHAVLAPPLTLIESDPDADTLMLMLGLSHPAHT
eukprot:973198-Rhodomonas_salina.1